MPLFPERIFMRQTDALRYDRTLFRGCEVFKLTCIPDELHHRDARYGKVDIEEAVREVHAGLETLTGDAARSVAATTRNFEEPVI